MPAVRAAPRWPAEGGRDERRGSNTSPQAASRSDTQFDRLTGRTLSIGQRVGEGVSGFRT